jgi:hypothetical protein
MKQPKNRCPLTPLGADPTCPLQPTQTTRRGSGPPSVVVVRTERRSWITIAITAFGALLLRYLKTVRERGGTVRRPRAKGKELRAKGQELRAKGQGQSAKGLGLGAKSEGVRAKGLGLGNHQPVNN